MNRYYYDELYHYGILGMKWGVRRYQNSDGSLTEAGKSRYNKLSSKRDSLSKKSAKEEYKINKYSAKIHNKRRAKALDKQYYYQEKSDKHLAKSEKYGSKDPWKRNEHEAKAKAYQSEADKYAALVKKYTNNRAMAKLEKAITQNDSYKYKISKIDVKIKKLGEEAVERYLEELKKK